ncbi:4887_t:CDS:2, partial [Racocetra persica]
FDNSNSENVPVTSMDPSICSNFGNPSIFLRDALLEITKEGQPFEVLECEEGDIMRLLDIVERA